VSGEPPALELTGIVKDYRGLRPLRIASLSISRGERLALSGLDRPAAEALINLLTGAALPDEGEVRIFGRPTSSIANGDDWLASLDRFGIVTDRAVLLEGSTIAQNLALPFTLALDELAPDVRVKVETLARDVGLEPSALEKRPAESAPDVSVRVHLARAIALGPAILLLEHPTASVPADAVAALADDVGRVARVRGLTTVAVTEDAAFARRMADRHLRVTGATGEVAPVRRFYFF
jgi:predicted ABC-type transport system involved in lysophospholipase L1 biosynthesis ATPase subunit